LNAARNVHTGISFIDRNLEIGVGLVVLELDIITGPVLLDEVAFQDKGFHFAGADNGLNGINMGIDGPHFRGNLTCLAKITPHSIL
jgi:hypothetical protein